MFLHGWSVWFVSKCICSVYSCCKIKKSIKHWDMNIQNLYINWHRQIFNWKNYKVTTVQLKLRWNICGSCDPCIRVFPYSYKTLPRGWHFSKRSWMNGRLAGKRVNRLHRDCSYGNYSIWYMTDVSIHHCNHSNHQGQP